MYRNVLAYKVENSSALYFLVICTNEMSFDQMACKNSRTAAICFCKAMRKTAPKGDQTYTYQSFRHWAKPMVFKAKGVHT